MSDVNQGFGAMTPERRREVAANGGRAAHQKGTAHIFTHEEAQAAGRKGGQTRQAQRRQAREKFTESADVPVPQQEQQ